MHVNLFHSAGDVLVNIVHEQIQQKTVSENGILEVDMSAVVLISDLVTMDEGYNGAVKELEEYNSYAKWVDHPFTVKFTSTPFKPILSDVSDFAHFMDTETYHRCSIVYAMSEIQSCEGVETRNFSKLGFNRIQVVCLYVIFKIK